MRTKTHTLAQPRRWPQCHRCTNAVTPPKTRVRWCEILLQPTRIVVNFVINNHWWGVCCFMFTRRTDISSTISTIPPSQIGRNPCLIHVATQWKHFQNTIRMQEHQIVTIVALWDEHSLDPWGSAHHQIWNAMLRFRNIPSPEIFLRCDTCPQYLGEGHQRSIVSWCNPPDKPACTARTRDK